MIGLMSETEIESILRRQRIGRIGCSVNDRPYVVPINYAYDGAYIYGYSAPGRKIEIMREQPLVCFEVDEVDSDNSWRSVVIEGRYQELCGHERDTALRHLSETDDEPVARSLTAGDRVIVFRLAICERSGRFEQRDA